MDWNELPIADDCYTKTDPKIMQLLDKIIKNQSFIEERLVRIESKVHLIGEELNINFRKPE